MSRSGEHYMPRPDGDFSAWAAHYAAAVKKFYDDQGLDPNLLTPLNKALDAWNALYPAHVKARAAAEGARQAKDAARAALETQVRPVTNFVQAWGGTTDADRATIGISVRGGTALPSRVPTTRPRADVHAGQRLTHTLRLTDEATPTRRARPRGVLGAEVWVKLIDAGLPAPTDPAALAFLTMATRPSITAEYRAADGGKTAVYMLRWVSTRGEKGPWSEVTTATVAA